MEVEERKEKPTDGGNGAAYTREGLQPGLWVRVTGLFPVLGCQRSGQSCSLIEED